MRAKIRRPQQPILHAAGGYAGSMRRSFGTSRLSIDHLAFKLPPCFHMRPRPMTWRSRFSAEDRFAARRKNNLGLRHCVTAFYFDQTIEERILPYGMPGTCARPGFHGFRVGSGTARHPSQKLQSQQCRRLVHRELIHRHSSADANQHQFWSNITPLLVL